MVGFIYYYNRGNQWEEDGLYLFGEPQMGDITYADALTFDQGGQSNVQVNLGSATDLSFNVQPVVQEAIEVQGH